MKSRSSFLLLHKPTGITSFSSLVPVKRIVDRKVGHAGTLDKFAEGLMVVLTGSFTKLNVLVSNLDKRYIATICFGIETSTLDPEGEVIATAPIPTLEMVEQALTQHFQGTIKQSPPQYSAIHIDGKRAHAMARSGEEFEIPPREVTLYETTILTWEPPFLTLAVHCSKGTYIRSLARDIGLKCNSRGYLTALKRTAIGPFKLEHAIDSQNAEALLTHAGTSLERLRMLGQMGSLTVSESGALRLGYGNLPSKDVIIDSKVESEDRYALVFDSHKTLLAVVGVDRQGLPNKVYALPCLEIS